MKVAALNLMSQVASFQTFSNITSLVHYFQLLIPKQACGAIRRRRGLNIKYVIKVLDFRHALQNMMTVSYENL